ncbi:O-acyltransferase WSD1-like family protein [Prunus dulcis]|uniref:diacylglycerol O-acyltransferase n=1 Tax=Prunus dulcis TaxID=3755 RepID=A0A4Y1R5Z6_PRUDU|nr:O-acyltransferase WSD1-like family protein [Prunus dulcis]
MHFVDVNGEKQWKRVEVKLRDHDYISNIILEQYPKDKPLWEVHIVKYPTSSAAGNLIFKFHHALGDGYSFMSALLSCLQRADNPLPLTFPSRRGSKTGGDSESIFRWDVSETFAFVFDTLKDFSWNSLLQDDRTPIRSGNYGVEFLPMTVSSITFSLDEIKLIKTKLNAPSSSSFSPTDIFISITYF